MVSDANLRRPEPKCDNRRPFVAGRAGVREPAQLADDDDVTPSDHARAGVDITEDDNRAGMTDLLPGAECAPDQES